MLMPDFCIVETIAVVVIGEDLDRLNMGLGKCIGRASRIKFLKTVMGKFRGMKIQMNLPSAIYPP